MPFDFQYETCSYVGPGCFYFKYVGFAKQTEQDVCWNAALTTCINGTHGARVLSTREVAAMCYTDKFVHKGLQPGEFVEAAGMVINSELCKIKIKLEAKKWSDNDIIDVLFDTLNRGNGAMISVNNNEHVQVVVGCTEDKNKILLYDTANESFQSLDMSMIKNHNSTEWVYLLVG
jgi:hypothetical protein